MSRRRLVSNAACAAVLLWWAGNAVYTGAKAIFPPLNGPVEQYLSVSGQDRVAAAVDIVRLEGDLLKQSPRMSALDLVHVCHEEVSRRFAPSEGRETGIDHLIETKTGNCFDYCGATYALALYVMRTHTHLMDRASQIRWVRGFAQTDNTLESAHCWLEAVGGDLRWHGYDAAVDVSSDPGRVFLQPIEDMLLKGQYISLNRKQADLGGRVRTSLTWRSILLGRKNLVAEAVSRLGLPPASTPAWNGVVFLALFLAASLVLSRRASPPQAPAVPAPLTESAESTEERQ